MNVFEDLIEELKEENLLEETVVEINKSSKTDEKLDEFSDDASFDAVEIVETQNPDFEVAEIEAESTDSLAAQDEFSDETVEENETVEETLQNTAAENDTPVIQSNFGDSASDKTETKAFDTFESENTIKFEDKAEFFRDRATSEVLSLQLVENVLAGVEREVMGLVPKIYDELPVKKALHDFLQISEKLQTPEHAQAEFQLMQETESWYSALTHRDKNIKVGHLRRFCENSRPALSSQALISLARFYRNAPYSEAVRSKFDLILTRLFSKDSGKGKRRLTLDHDKLIEQIGKLYAEWSSVPLYSTEEDDSAIVIAALKMEDFIKEAESANSFEELVNNDFFNRLRVFKESTQENFFAPLLAATVIESNVKIGNRYAELFENENGDAETLEEKYGLLHEQTISEVICKTLEIKNIINKQVPKPVAPQPKKIVTVQAEPAQNEKPQTEVIKETKNKKPNNLFKVNKWLLALTILTILGTIGLYIWVESVSEKSNAPTNVKNVNLENSILKEYIQGARISTDTFYGVVLPAWDGLSRDKKEEFLKKILLIGNEKGYTRVNLINKQGKTVGYASGEKVEISNP